MRPRQIDQPAVVVGRIVGLMVDPLREQRIELRIGQAALLAAVIVPQLALVAELPLARRVIHQRHQPDVAAVDQFLGFGDDARHRHFAAQVQEMSTRSRPAARACAMAFASVRPGRRPPRRLPRVQTRSESSTVVMPVVASWPSNDTTAATGSQCTLGRGA